MENSPETNSGSPEPNGEEHLSYEVSVINLLIAIRDRLTIACWLFAVPIIVYIVRITAMWIEGRGR